MSSLMRLLIGANVAVFALEAVSGHAFLASFALWLVGHLAVAQSDVLVGLWMFGSDAERAIGSDLAQAERK